MKVKVQVIVESENNEVTIVEEVAELSREELTPETLGLTLEEAKTLLANLQSTLVEKQVSEYAEKQRHCSDCGKTRPRKGHHQIVFRTLFGKVTLQSPRLYTCACQPNTTRSESPVAQLLTERTAPELLYLQAKWASLMSYGLTVNLLEEVLPLQANVASVFRNLHDSAQRSESELGEEQHIYIDGCPRDWEDLPCPDLPLTVGIDGCFVHAREGDNRKAGWFFVIVGKSITAEGEKKCGRVVNDYDQKPKRRLFELLNSQGLQLNQTLTFLSDGGDTVRDLQLYLSPNSEHLLDWFHMTMRITVMTQMAKGLADKKQSQQVCDELERIKWYLWHGNVFCALQELDDLRLDLEPLGDETDAQKKLWRAVDEFHTYISNNGSFIPNYRDRYYYGEAISTGFVESTVNQVVSKRMVKKQQMRWTKRGAHNLLQVRTKVQNDEWRDTFCRWYPNMTSSEETEQLAA